MYVDLFFIYSRSASPRPVTPVAKVTEAEKRKGKYLCVYNNWVLTRVKYNYIYYTCINKLCVYFDFLYYSISAKANLLKDFPNHELAVIDMALESCDHNESKARTLLKSMEPPPKKKT